MNRIIPEWGETDIRELSEGRVESWLFRLKQEQTGAKTLNHLITVLRIIFGFALKNRDIDENPMANIELFALKTVEKGVFTRTELTQLFSGGPESGIWDSKLHFTLNLTAAMTGMRLGEILALKYEMVRPNLITVAYSWSESDKLKCPKNGKVRHIPIPENLYQLFQSLREEGPSSDFIFSGGDTPMYHKTVLSVFRRFISMCGQI